MLSAHAARALAIGSLGALILLDEIVFWVIPLVAFVEGSGAAVHSAAQGGCAAGGRAEAPVARSRVGRDGP